MDDQFIGEAGVVDQGLTANFFFVGMDFVHPGCDDDARNAEGVDFVGVAPAKSCSEEWVESASATSGESVFDDRAFFGNCVRHVMAFVVDFDLGSPLVCGSLATFAHVGDLGVEIGEGS